MRNRFDRQLEKLNTELINMGALCEDAMTCAVHAIFDKDEALIEKTEERERQIDQMERDVENLCMRLCCSSSRWQGIFASFHQH